LRRKPGAPFEDLPKEESVDVRRTWCAIMPGKFERTKLIFKPQCTNGYHCTSGI
jgi:hypothetical protein